MDNELIYLIKGIDKPTNEHLGRSWKGERVNIEIIKMTYPDKTDESEKIGVLVDGKELGIFDSDPQLPIETKAEANIEPVLGGTILANYQNIQIKIGVLKKYDYKEVNFQGEVVKIVIDFIKATDSTYSIHNSNFEGREKIPVARMGERTIREIKKESIPVLTKLGAYKPGAVLDVILTRTEPYNTVLNLKIDPNTIVTPKPSRRMQSSTTAPAAPTTASSTTTPAQIVIEGINLHQWKNTHWNGDIVPLKVCQGDIPGYEGYYAIKVYEKVLGRLAKSNPHLPLGTQFYAYLITENDCVLATIIDEDKKPQSQIKGYSRPQWELDLIKIARHLSINTEIQRRSLQIARVWDYTFIYSGETETLYLMSTREKRGKLYQAKRGQPAKVCNLNLEDLAFFAKQKRKIEYQKKWKENSPESESKNLSFFKATATDEFTEDCLRKLKYYEQEYLSSLLNYGEFEYEFQPQYLREWLKRNNIPGDEAITEKQLKENINDYVFFLYWLIERKEIDLIELMGNGEFIENYYGDTEVEEYKVCCRENAEIAKAEESLSNWEWTMQEEENFEKEHGWMEDGEYQLMRYLEGLNEVPEEFEESEVVNKESLTKIEQTSLNIPRIVVSYSDDEMTSYEVQQVWNQYAEKAGLKAEEHIKVLVEQKKGYYPQIHRIEVSPSLLQAVGGNPINFILDREF